MEKELRASLGAAIRAYRKKGNLTLNQLAEMADIDSGFLTYIEHGKKSPCPGSLARIAHALGVSVFQLFKAPPGKTRDAAYACVIRSSRAAFWSTPITFAPKHGILGVDNLDRVYYVY